MTSNSSPRWFDARHLRLELGRRTIVMGIVNVTPDSFSDGGEAFYKDHAILRATTQFECGADIIDVGGESTRPGSEPVSLEQELERVIPVVNAVARQSMKPVSIDTYKSEVADRALEAGAAIVNDISAGTFDPDMPGVVRKRGAGVILMHIKGSPRDMQKNPQYRDVVEEVKEFLLAAEARFLTAGVPKSHILVDPGIGFGKNLEHNLTLTANLHQFSGIGAGILYGPSRKSFIGLLTGREVHDRLAGTLGAVLSGVHHGADVVRVHDVKEVIDALKVADACSRFQR
jgi:dihydropteroate synthase